VKPLINLRQAVSGDSLAVAEVYLRARRAAIPYIPPCVHNDDEVRSWITDVVIPAQDTWVAVMDDEIVAMMALQNSWIHQLYVAPDWGGKGIGSRLIQLAKERYPCSLELWTFESNHGARRFYERNGFLEVEREDGTNNEEGAPAIRYQWKPSSL
jgi:GNAT superfamily N-acetyltransferase